MTVVFLVLRLSTPSDGARQALGASVTSEAMVTVFPLDESINELRSGDQVLRADGQDVGVWTRTIFDPAGSSAAWHTGQTIVYTVRRGDEVIDVPVTLRQFPLRELVEQNLLIAAFLVLVQVQAIWMWWRGRGARATQPLLLVASAFVALSICWYVGMDFAGLANSRGLFLFYRASTCTQLIVMSAALLHFAIVLPNSNQLVRLSRERVLALYLLPFLGVALFIAGAYTPDALAWLRRWELGIIGVIFGTFIMAVVSLVSADRRIPSSVLRSRVRFVAATLAITLLIGLVVGMLPILLTGQVALGWQIVPLLSLPVVVGFGIAVVFYRLFDIRVAIQRTLVWSMLTALIVGVYVVVVGLLGALFHDRGSALFSLIATGVVAVIFNTVRARFQGAVNWLLYGERDTPYEMVSALSQRMEKAIVPEEALAQIVKSIAMALRLPFAAIELAQDHEFIRVTSWGETAQDLIDFPFNHGGETVGRLVVAPRTPGEALTPGDHRLLTGLLYHADSVVQAARLTSDLQRTREKLVLAREEERRRLRRDLHDGLGPTLAGLALQIDAASNLLEDDPGKAKAILLDVKSQTRAAVTEVRRMAYELHPVTLEQLGLSAALTTNARQLADESGVCITVTVANNIPPLPAAVEVAVYTICMGAMTNVVRHAQATRCDVQLSCNHVLRLEVSDNGQGLPVPFRRGVGINSMIERAAELGGTCSVEAEPSGGVRVVALIPLSRLPVSASGC